MPQEKYYVGDFDKNNEILIVVPIGKLNMHQAISFRNEITASINKAQERTLELLNKVQSNASPQIEHLWNKHLN